MSVQSTVVLHVPIESIFGTLTLLDQLVFITKRDKEQQERIVVVLPLVLPTGVEQFVIGENTIFEFMVLPLTVFVYSRLCVVGHKVVETHIVHLVWPLGIERVNEIGLKYVSRVWIMLSDFLEFRVILQPTLPVVRLAYINPLYGL